MAHLNHDADHGNKSDIQSAGADHPILRKHCEKTGHAIFDLFSQENRKKVIDAVGTIFDENARKKVRDAVTTVLDDNTKKKVAETAVELGKDLKRQVNKVEDYATPLVKEAGKVVYNVWTSIKKIKF